MRSLIWTIAVVLVFAIQAMPAQSGQVELYSQSNERLAFGWLFQFQGACMIFTPKHTFEMNGGYVYYSGQNGKGLFRAENYITGIDDSAHFLASKLNAEGGDCPHTWTQSEVNINSITVGQKLRIYLGSGNYELAEFDSRDGPNIHLKSSDNVLAGQSGAPIYLNLGGSRYSNQPIAFLISANSIGGIKNGIYKGLFRQAAAAAMHIYLVPIETNFASGKGVGLSGNRESVGNNPSDISITPSKYNTGPVAKACDRLASHPSDPFRAKDSSGKLVPGVNATEFSNKRSLKRARDACKRMLVRYPNVPRYHYLAARLSAMDFSTVTPINVLDEIHDNYRRASEVGYPFSGFSFLVFLKNHGKVACPDGLSDCVEEALGFLKDAVKIAPDWAHYQIGDAYTDGSMNLAFQCKVYSTCGDLAITALEKVSPNSSYAHTAEAIIAYVLSADDTNKITEARAVKRPCGSREGCLIEGWKRFVKLDSSLPGWASRLLGNHYWARAELGVKYQLCRNIDECHKEAFGHYTSASIKGDSWAAIERGKMIRKYPILTKCQKNGNKAKCNELAIKEFEKAAKNGLIDGKHYHVWTLINRPEGTVCRDNDGRNKKACYQKIDELAGDPAFDDTTWGKELIAISLEERTKEFYNGKKEKLCNDNKDCLSRAFKLYKVAAKERDYSKYRLGRLYQYNKEATDCKKKNCVADAIEMYEQSNIRDGIISWGYLISGACDYGGLVCQNMGLRWLKKAATHDLHSAKFSGIVFSIFGPARIGIFCMSDVDRCKQALDSATSTIIKRIDVEHIASIRKLRFTNGIGNLGPTSHCTAEYLSECSTEVKSIFRGLARNGSLEAQLTILLAFGEDSDLCYDGDLGCNPGNMTIEKALKGQSGGSLFKLLLDEDISISVVAEYMALAETKGSRRAGILLAIHEFESREVPILGDKRLFFKFNKRIYDYLDPSLEKRNWRKFNKYINIDEELTLAAFSNLHMISELGTYMNALKSYSTILKDIIERTLRISLVQQCIMNDCKGWPWIEFDNQSVSKPVIKKLQSFYGAEVDGKFGNDTRSAIERFTRRAKKKAKCSVDNEDKWDCNLRVINRMITNADFPSLLSKLETK